MTESQHNTAGHQPHLVMLMCRLPQLGLDVALQPNSLVSLHHSQCRYMVIHEYGGVYADMDTECFQPVEHWAPRGCQFVAAVEHNLHFCQWAFAAVPGNGAIGRILELTMRKMINREYKYAPLAAAAGEPVAMVVQSISVLYKPIGPPTKNGEMGNGENSDCRGSESSVSPPTRGVLC